MQCVLLIVLDCVRADHVSAYGYQRPTTPTIDGLAKSGALWERAYSSSSWTKPSIASLLTGLYPSEHGVFRGVKRRRKQDTAKSDALHVSTPTIAEAFSKAGWRCGAFLNNAQLAEYTNLSRGFERYIPNAGKVDHLLEMFETWFKSDVQRPTFAYLHLLEAHWPYRPRRRHVAMFGGDRDASMFCDFSAHDYGKLKRRIKKGEETLSPNAVIDMVQMYDGAIRRLDGKVKKIMRLLECLGLAEKTTVVVTADHGEELYEHGSIGHGHSLSELQTHVPLIITQADGLSASRISHPVSLVDLAPTLLKQAGVPCDWSKANLLGVAEPLVPVCSELLIGRKYMQAYWKDNLKILHYCKFAVPEGSQKRSQQTPRITYNKSLESESYELFDLHRDAGERANLAEQSQYRSDFARLSSDLKHWWESCKPRFDEGKPVEVSIDESVVRRLRALGYLD